MSKILDGLRWKRTLTVATLLMLALGALALLYTSPAHAQPGNTTIKVLSSLNPIVFPVVFEISDPNGIASTQVNGNPAVNQVCPNTVTVNVDIAQNAFPALLTIVDCQTNPATERFELDLFPNSTVLVQLQGGPFPIPTALILSGAAIVAVDLNSLDDISDEADPATAGPPNDPNSLDEIQTEIVSMELTDGGGVTLRAGHSFAPLSRSFGQIEETTDVETGRLDLPGPPSGPPFHNPFCNASNTTTVACGSTGANSFFDVFFEIEVGPDVVHNGDALRIEAMINEKPPSTRYIHIIPTNGPIELLLPDDSGSGIKIVQALHDTRPVEIDLFPNSRADIIIDTPQGETALTLSGPSIVIVEIDPDTGADPTPGDGAGGRDKVDTELVSMSLTGGGVTLRAGALNGLPASLGEITENSNPQPGILDVPNFGTPGGTADSFFDVFFEVEVPSFGTLHNRQAARLEALIRDKPPKPGDKYCHVDISGIPLFNEAEQDTGVRLIKACHTPEITRIGGSTSFLTGGSGTSVGGIATLAGSVAAALAILAASGWYARRRWHGRS